MHPRGWLRHIGRKDTFVHSVAYCSDGGALTHNQHGYMAAMTRMAATKLHLRGAVLSGEGGRQQVGTDAENGQHFECGAARRARPGPLGYDALCVSEAASQRRQWRSGSGRPVPSRTACLVSPRQARAGTPRCLRQARLEEEADSPESSLHKLLPVVRVHFIKGALR